MTACTRRWGRWFFRCPNADRHECAGERWHAAVHVCRHCGALLLVHIL